MHYAWLITIASMLVLGAVAAPIATAYFGRQAAAKAFPAAAARLGLRREGAALPGGIGKYTGEVNGRRIVARPDAHGSILAIFEDTLGGRVIYIAADDVPDIMTAGLESFDFNDGGLNTRFRARYAHAQLVDALRADRSFATGLMPLFENKAWKVRAVTIDQDGVSCSLKSGEPFYHFIPPEVLAPLVAQLAAVADIVEVHTAVLVREE